MEDVFYMCPKELRMSEIKLVFVKNEVTDIGFEDEGCIQLIFTKASQALLKNHIGKENDNDIDHFIEFYIFEDIDAVLEQEELRFLKEKEIKTVIGILHHRGHISEVLKYTRMLMKEWGGKAWTMK